MSKNNVKESKHFQSAVKDRSEMPLGFVLLGLGNKKQ